MESQLQPVTPILAADRFAPLGDALVDLLSSLEPADWQAPTVCADWAVRDVAAHLLDGACRRLSFERDGLPPPSPSVEPPHQTDLIAILDGLNASWVEASRRLSPRLLTELTAAVEPMLAAHVEALAPFSAALFPVAWAGDAASACWFDIARELTERWHHQQQIRLAVGAAPLDEPFFVEPVLEALVRVLPHHFAVLPAAPHTTVALVLRQPALRWTLQRDPDRWVLLRGAPTSADAAVEMDADTAWRLLTRGLSPAEARRRARVAGDAALAGHLFTAVAVMARPREDDHD